MNPEVAPLLPPPAFVGQGHWEVLDPRYIPVKRIAAAGWSAAATLFWLVVAVAASFATHLPEQYRVPVFLTWAVLAVAHALWNQYKPSLQYRHASFRLDDEEIEIRRGVFFRSIISVPRSRVQHTDVSQGPLERRYGLGTLEIYTAGVSHAQVTLEGLAHERAVEIRDALLPRDRVTRA